LFMTPFEINGMMALGGALRAGGQDHG
jgi:hypothetical protein